MKCKSVYFTASKCIFSDTSLNLQIFPLSSLRQFDILWLEVDIVQVNGEAGNYCILSKRAGTVK